MMEIWRAVWISGDVERVTLLRDTQMRGDFLCGIECNEHGIAVRTEGCSGDAELMIRSDRIRSFETVEAKETA